MTDTSHSDGNVPLTGTADAHRLKATGVSDADVAVVQEAATLFDAKVGDVRKDGLHAAEAWDAARARLQLGERVIATWFRPTHGVAVEGSTLTVAVPNADSKRWLLSNYQTEIRRAMDEAGFSALKVVLIVRTPQPDAAPIARLAGRL